MILPPLIQGRLIRRYKRFLADIRLEDGSTVTAHVPNTGAMRSTSEPGRLAGLSIHTSPKRKYQYTLEIIESDEGGTMVSVNTMRTNRIVEEAILEGSIPELTGYKEIRREVPYGNASRVDLLLFSSEKKKCFVEVKNVTYKEGDLALFPDAVTARGTKHLHELIQTVKAGHRAAIFFLVGRGDCRETAPAEHIDPVYAKTLDLARAEGVEILSYRTAVDFSKIVIDRRLKVAKHINCR